MVYKFGRNYVLNVQTHPSSAFALGDQPFITVQPPFTMEFDIIRNTLSSANNCNIRVYNLSEKKRNQILHDQYVAPNTQVNLRAGYQDDMFLIFSGWINKCWSVREGNNFITQIQCFDGGNAYVDATCDNLPPFPTGTTYRDIIIGLINSMEPFGVRLGKVGMFKDQITKPYPVSGSTISSIRDIAGKNAVFIDNGVCNVLLTNEYIEASPMVPIISSETGLLGTPTRQETFLIFDILFEPRLSIGQRIQLKSNTANNYNSEYKIASIQHKGVISDAICGDAVTTIGVFAKAELFNAP